LDEEKIQRINVLAKKKKEEGLTAEELQEQKELYALYLASVRKQVKAQLANAGIKPKHSHCSCGHHHDGECHH